MIKPICNLIKCIEACDLLTLNVINPCSMYLNNVCTCKEYFPIKEGQLIQLRAENKTMQQ